MTLVTADLRWGKSAREVGEEQREVRGRRPEATQQKHPTETRPGKPDGNPTGTRQKHDRVNPTETRRKHDWVNPTETRPDKADGNNTG